MMERRDTIALVKKIIENLPELQRTVIQMRDVDGYELQEIAGITGMQIGAVTVNLSRARKKVRETLIGIMSYELRIMDYGDINILMEKYFDGLTLLEEEQALRDYFQEEDVLPEWKMYRPMFRYFTSEREGKNQVISSSRSQVKRILLRWGSLRGKFPSGQLENELNKLKDLFIKVNNKRIKL